ncbi:MAG: hypothetical protein ACR2MI_04645 [Flavobacteriaceae bacterium]
MKQFNFFYDALNINEPKLIQQIETFASLEIVKEEEIQNAFAHDIPKEIFDIAKLNIVPEPSAPLQYELQISDQHSGSIPKYYIECTEDRAIPIAVQRGMYQENVIKSYSLNSSHTPNFSKPKKVASILLEIRNEISN